MVIENRGANTFAPLSYLGISRADDAAHRWTRTRPPTAKVRPPARRLGETGTSFERADEKAGQRVEAALDAAGTRKREPRRAD